jgi:hypothetical protein
VAAGDLGWCENLAQELAEIANVYGTPALHASAACARGAVALAEGDVAGAVRQCRASVDLFRQAELPYNAARARQLLAEALLADNDLLGASLELEAAARIFDRLGAGPDARVALRQLAQLQAKTSQPF